MNKLFRALFSDLNSHFLGYFRILELIKELKELDNVIFGRHLTIVEICSSLQKISFYQIFQRKSKLNAPIGNRTRV